MLETPSEMKNGKNAQGYGNTGRLSAQKIADAVCIGLLVPAIFVAMVGYTVKDLFKK